VDKLVVLLKKNTKKTTENKESDNSLHFTTRKLMLKMWKPVRRNA